MPRLACLILVLCAALAAPAQAREVWSLRTVLAQSWATSPELAAARAQVDIARENVARAQAGWRPTARVYADVTDTQFDTEPGDDIHDGTEKTIGAELTQPLYRGGSTRAEVDGARAALEAARARLKSAEQALLLDTATAYMNVLEAHELATLARANHRVLAKELSATRQRFELGDVTRTDVSQAEARLARAQADVTEREGLLDTAGATFTQVAGIALEPNDKLTPPPEDVLAPILPASRAQALSQARAQSPRVAQAMAAARAARHGIRAVRGELLPQIGLTAGVEQEYDPVGTRYDERTGTSVGLRASLPLYQGGDTRARLRQSRHEAQRAEDLLAAARREAEREAVQSWTVWEAARAIAVARQAQARAQGVARQGVRKEADLGARTVLDVLNADQEYLDAQAALVSARRTEVVARFALAAVLGLLVAPQ